MTSWHTQTSVQAMDDLSTSASGLTGTEAGARLQRYGPNELLVKKGPGPLALFARQFTDPLVAILLVAAAISFIVWLIEGGTDGLIDTVVIMAIVLINAALGFYQEYKAERTLEALRDLASPQATVVRDGREMDVPSKELVPGDVIVLATGDKISADARLLEAINLDTIEAALTGESTPVTKNADSLAPEDAPVGDRSNMVHSGTVVGRGRGRAVVVATGMGTELGKIAGLVSTGNEGTPLQKKLARLSGQLGIAVLAIAILIFILGLLRQVPLLDMFLTSVSLAVAAIPEGLPAVVTVCLALGLARMAKRNAVVRTLPSVESLGSATVICSDKTGTLTTGEMSVTEVALASRTVDVTGRGYEPSGELLLGGGKAEVTGELSWLIRAGALCNDSRLEKDRAWTVIGDTTEGTLLVLALKAGTDLEALKAQYPRVGEVPFDSESKRMTTVHLHEGRKYIFTKGAAESVLPLCDKVMTDGREVVLDDRLRDEMAQKDREMAGRALRVLAFSMKESAPDDPAPVEGGATFLGLVGMIDSPRPDAVEAIARCHTAGIRVIMITGDHERTAEAIARQMGIGDGSTPAISGKELSAMPPEELATRVKKASVFARVSPENKVDIVKALQANGEVVAMTGDGVNDAPALKRADIGVAMGITGTDVAKESADIVLVDDNFSSIAGAVEEGRGIYDNIRKFVAFLLSCNGGELALIFAATVLLTDPAFLPFLLPIQILWVNLVTDSFPALALGLDPTDPGVMRRCPRDPKEGPVTRDMAYRIVLLSASMAVSGLLVFQLSMDLTGDVDRARTAVFCTLVLTQLFMVFSFRSERSSVLKTGIRGNVRLVYAVLLSLALQLAVVYLPGLSDAFRTVPLELEWAFIIPLALLGLVVNEVIKYALRRLRGDDGTCEVRVDAA
ncbi:MAG: HAD-IC family P-type ATPase [Methanomassiliicoccus sp.]|nr:HAD-IC family P-type ATPase [Methanomassiliicoccus sp.]